MKEPSQTIYFATSNQGKYLEAVRIVSSFGIRLKRLAVEKYEIQSDKLQEIASLAAVQASQTSSLRVVSEDSGFFVKALHNFPGPYSSYAFKTIGPKGILRLMRESENRDASFLAAVAYCEPKHAPICFTGQVKGTVSRVAKGTLGFGFDPIFVPRAGNGRTFAQMDIEEKSVLSHRAKAFTEFARWYVSCRRPGSKEVK